MKMSSTWAKHSAMRGWVAVHPRRGMYVLGPHGDARDAVLYLPASRAARLIDRSSCASLGFPNIGRSLAGHPLRNRAHFWNRPLDYPLTNRTR
jgi:hypothetical protein